MSLWLPFRISIHAGKQVETDAWQYSTRNCMYNSRTYTTPHVYNWGNVLFFSLLFVEHVFLQPSRAPLEAICRIESVFRIQQVIIELRVWSEVGLG